MSSPDTNLDHTFQNLQRNIATLMIIIAIFSTVVAIHGAFTAVLMWNSLVMMYGALQFSLTLLTLISGAVISNSVSGSQGAFERFGGNDGIPYYDCIYYGSIAIASYGSLFVLTILILTSSFVFGKFQARRHRNMERAQGLENADRNRRESLHV
jgi:surface polysaccharide O-acyltransferase-like enzyme